MTRRSTARKVPPGPAFGVGGKEEHGNTHGWRVRRGWWPQISTLVENKTINIVQLEPCFLSDMYVEEELEGNSRKVIGSPLWW